MQPERMHFLTSASMSTQEHEQPDNGFYVLLTGANRLVKLYYACIVPIDTFSVV